MEKTDAFDPITLELIKNALNSIVNDMALTVILTSYSPLMRESFDFGTGFVTAKGELIAEGLTVPTHGTTSASVVATMLRTYSGSIKPGDIFITNDPYEGAAHLPDIFLCKPVFIDGELATFAASVAHQADIGGRVAGGNACDNTEIYQEGLRIPPLKLYDQGTPNEAIFKIIEKNVRLPWHVRGDIGALLAAVYTGEKRFLELVQEYSWPTLHKYLDELLNYSERMVRDEIRALPDGVYEFTDYIDDDGFDPDPIRLHVKIIIEGDSIIADYRGTSRQVKGSINCPVATLISNPIIGLRCLFNPDIPVNGGMVRSLKVIAPKGTIVNPNLPAAVAARGVVNFRLTDILFGALGQILPDKFPACGINLDTGLTISGYDTEGKPFIYIDFLMGSWGARPWADGIDANTAVIINYSNEPIEVVEREAPILIERCEFVPDSGGPGRYRGGLAIVRDYLFQGEEGTFQIRSDRHRFPAYGLQGGKPGSPSLNYYDPLGENRLLTKTTMLVKKGDRFRIQLAGAGGFGNPFERDPERVLADVVNEKVTIEGARKEYGVAMDEKTMKVDIAETRKLREAAKRTEAQLSQKGSNRERG